MEIASSHDLARVIMVLGCVILEVLLIAVSTMAIDEALKPPRDGPMLVVVVLGSTLATIVLGLTAVLFWNL